VFPGTSDGTTMPIASGVPLEDLMKVEDAIHELDVRAASRSVPVM